MVGYNEYQNNAVLPRRRAFFIFGDDDEKADKFVLEGLNLKFDVTYYGGAVFPAAQFAICNLNADHLAYLTNFFGRGNPRRRNRTIRFFAGYDDAKTPVKQKDVPLLYQGVVEFTSVSAPPDMWMNISTLGSGQLHAAKVKISLPGEKTVREIAEVAAKLYKLDLEWKSDNPGDRKIKDFSTDGDGWDFAGTLNVLDRNLTFSSDSLRLRVMDRKPPMDNLSLPRWKLDRDHAMIGAPRFRYNGAEVDTLLNPLARPGDLAILKSHYQPAGDGVYQIVKIRHHGELRGNDFNTTFDLVRPT